MAIRFFSENISYQLNEQEKVMTWLSTVIKSKGKLLSNINYIFCDDEYLIDINQKYLGHDTYTDIITFDNSEKKNELEADIYISVERVKENAEKFDIENDEELRRVMVHGILHLCGLQDKLDDEKEIMRVNEDECLEIYNQLQ